MSEIATEEELKCWLNSALKTEGISDFRASIEGNSEKGDGYMGNILFVKVTSAVKTHHLVLKCSKKSAELREALPVKAAFENEIYLYENAVPVLTAFQRKKGVEPFTSLPKFYCSYVSENTEIVVLENLKTRGYYLCDRTKPLPASHLRLVLKEYGKWHAISAAMQDQDPENYRKMAKGARNVWKLFAETTDTQAFFAPVVDETYELLKTDLPKATAEKLKNFKSQIEKIVTEVIETSDRFSVITHGDCWNNNFMFKSEGGVLKVAILDWQTMKWSSPVMDISYFIYACASQEDLSTFDSLLKLYHDSFSDCVRLLGSDPEKIFPFSRLLEDFKWFGKYGVMLTLLAVKVALSDKQEAPDFAESVHVGFENTFSFKNRNQALLKSRMLYIIEHVATQDIL